MAQAGDASRAKKASGKRQAVSAGPGIPLGDFSDTHFGGIHLEYARSNHRFGKLTAIPSVKIGFMAEAGLAYYFGKKEMVSGYSYRYPGYYFIHASPGFIYNLCKEGNIIFSAGPALGIYNGNMEFNIHSKLQGTYSVNEKMGITPALLIMKELSADPLFAVSLKATMAF